MYRIAELLLALQKAGNVLYLNWMVTFNLSHCFESDCSEEPKLVQNLANHLSKELLTYAKVMDTELARWKQEVEESRCKYYELNYYTTAQLLKLRSELGLMKKDCTEDVDAEVISLLQSVYPGISCQYLHRTICCEGEDGIVQSPSPTTPEYQSKATPLTINDHNPSEAEKNQDDSYYISCPKVSLTEDELNDEQKDILLNLCERFKFCKELVLKAMEENPPAPNSYKYTIRNWCLKHEHSYKFEGNEVILCEEEFEDFLSESEDENEDDAPIYYFGSQQLIFGQYTFLKLLQ